MAGRGRPSNNSERTSLLLRVPTELVTAVDTFKASLEGERGGFGIHRNDLLIRLIEVGLQTLTQARHPSPPAAPLPDHPAVPSHKKRRKDALPLPTLRRIAEERRQYPDISLRSLSQHLYTTGIYRGQGKRGSEVAVSSSVLSKWLDEAHALGWLD